MENLHPFDEKRYVKTHFGNINATDQIVYPVFNVSYGELSTNH